MQKIDNARRNNRDLQHGWGQSQRERRIAQILRRAVGNSVNIEHINPEGVRRQDNFRTLVENLHESERLLADRSDTVYVEGLRPTLRLNQDLWPPPLTQNQAGEAMLRFSTAFDTRRMSMPYSKAFPRIYAKTLLGTVLYITGTD